MSASILAWQFKSGLTLLEALLALQMASPEYAWRIHDSEAYGRYLQGLSQDGVKVKVYQDMGELEAWLPTDGVNASVVTFSLKKDVFPALQAEEIVRD